MRRPKAIIGSAVAFYAVVMAIGWSMTTELSRKKTLRALKEARENFRCVSEDAVDGVLWYASQLVFDEIGETVQPRPLEWMQALAMRHHLDEINVVDRQGRVVASNLAREYGHNFADDALTAKFLRVLQPGQSMTCYGQPYRPSFTDRNCLYKYFGVAFPDRSGLIQLGFSLENLVKAFRHTPAKSYKNWNIGVYGHFEGVDTDGDGLLDFEHDWPGRFPPDGVMGETDDPKLGHVFTYTFSYAGLLFRAVIPQREFHEQRNLMLKVGGSAMAVILAFFTYLFIRLAVSSEKLEAMHREADARNANDLALARVIQLSSLPRTELFRISCFDCTFAAVSNPAREVGGDFYSLFELQDGRIVFLVADVSGKGVPAALFMHIASSTFYAGFRLLADDSTSDTVAAINNYLCDNNEAEMFVTAWVGVLDPKNGDIEYVNAGHNRPYVVRRDGRVERIDGKGGLFLGLYPRRSYQSARLHLDAGDRLFLYTDGVTEAMDGSKHVYGALRLEQLLASAPDDLCAAVTADVDAHVAGAERSDDLTMLTLTWIGQPPCVRRTFTASESSLGDAVDFMRSEVKLSDAKQKSRLLNAADEMLANVVGYSGAKEFTVAVENVSGRSRVTISDAGKAYNPLSHADPDTHVALEDRPVGGLGILMAKKLVGAATYRREGGCNVLTLVQTDYNGYYRQLR